MKKKILLIDGLSIANRAFYGIPLLTTQEGEYTNAIYGFINIMLSVLEKEKPDLIGVAFDVSAPTFRHIKVADYKGNRKGMPQELRPQIPVLKEVLKAMGIHTLEKEGYEADDLLGTLAKDFEQKGYHVVVLSGDRDLLQVTSETIELKIPKTKRTGTEIESYFAQDVEASYEVTPTQFIDVKGLMGDPSDNIKGVPGVGEKTAIRLIKTYGSIENLYAHVDEIKQKKLHENLVTYKDQALESKMLATILCDVALEYKEQDFQYELLLNEQLLALFKRLEFKKLIDKLATPEFVTTPDHKTSLEITTIDAFLAQKPSHYSCHYFYEASTLFLALANEKQVATACYNLEEDHHQKTLEDLFGNTEATVIIHDSKTFRHVLHKHHIKLKNNVFDTMIAAYLCSPTESAYDLADIENMYLGTATIASVEQLLGKGKNKIAYLDLDEDKIKAYMESAAQLLVRIHKSLAEKMQVEEMDHLFYEIEMPLVEVLFDMEKEGIRINPEKLKNYGKSLDERIEQTGKRIYEIAGEAFNINSPKQLGNILFEKMGIPPVKKTKTGYSTAAEVLETLSVDYPIVKDILAYRQYTKLKSTYVDGLLNVMTKDHKIHSSFNQTITATGRISSTEPNLQNIPVKLELGKKIREVFIPSDEEHVFLDADYSQIELRVLAAMAEDEVLIEAFNEGRDIHRLTASQVFHVPFDEVTPLQRSNAKAVNFGIVYGIGAFSLAQDLGTTQKEASAYIANYFEKYPKIKRFLDGLVAEATLYGHVETLFHRRRAIPELQSKNHNLREFGKRKAMNTPIQGTAADIIKIAMVNVHRALKAQKLQSKLILTVHDELLLDVYLPEKDQVAALLKHEMEHAVQLRVKMQVDVHAGNNWLEVK